MPIDFNDTEVAFKGKSSFQLQKAYWLFKIVSSKTMVAVGSAVTKTALTLRLPINYPIKKTIFQQFCGGEYINECDATIKELSAFNIGTILDYSVEGKESNDDLDATTNEIIKTIEKAKNNEGIPFAVFKPTGVSKFSLLEKANEGIAQLSPEDHAEYQKVIDRIDKICKKAFELKVPVFVDAEDSWIQDAIDRIVDEMMLRYNQEEVYVYNTIQMYRWDRLEFLKASHAKAKANGYKLGIKLVRGAYMEKERARALEKGYPSPIQENKEASDKDYDLALTYCVENVEDIALCGGTHNEKSSLHLASLIDKNGIAKNDKRIYFAQLLGMSDHISYNLANAGYNVAKYVPYGPIREVLPYLIRRAEENTSVSGQTGRELSLIIKERNRRKGKSN
ncbi:MAG: proline dehydrogenase family protein [Flavobacteriales bacterium]|jgi:proline dehydrogenase|nr:proline dehydrogenase family protein [Flavobacteriales bacterium]